MPVGATLVPTAAAAPATPAPAAVTAFTADDPVTDVRGLKGEYFRMSAPGARDFAELGATALDPEIDFPGLTGTSESATGRTEHTTARWTGQLEAPETGTHTFSAIGDNGFRLFLDGNVVIDHWQPDWDNERHSEPIVLKAGEKHDFKLEMFQDVGGASMFLRWQSDTVKKQIVPESAFTPPADFEVYPVALSVAQNGKRLQVTFKDRVGNHGKVKDHLKIEVDTSPMPVKAVRRASDNPRALVVDLAATVLKGQRVKVVYDGKGGLTSGAETVPEIGRTAKNLGTEGIDLSVGSTMALAAALLPLYLGYGLVPASSSHCSPERSSGPSTGRRSRSSGCNPSSPPSPSSSAAGAWPWCTLALEYTATTDRPTVVNLTHHAYFDLGADDIRGHTLQVDADHYLPVDPDSIPEGPQSPSPAPPSTSPPRARWVNASPWTTPKSPWPEGSTTAGCCAARTPRRSAGPPASPPPATGAPSNSGPPNRGSRSAPPTSSTGRSPTAPAAPTSATARSAWRPSTCPTRPTAPTTPAPSCALAKPCAAAPNGAFRTWAPKENRLRLSAAP